MRYPGMKTVIVGGFAADMCVLFTANDAYLRDFKVVIVEDSVASNDPENCGAALVLMRRVLKADISKAADIVFRAQALDKPV